MSTSPAAHAAENLHKSSSAAVEARAAAIGSLVDDALIERIDSLSRLERCNTLEVLLYLAEVDRRKLWRTLEFRSMFDYCIRRLRYSEAAASRRIRTARLIGRYPQVYRRIQAGRLSLCAVAKIARAVLEDGRADLIRQIEGKRLDQVDAMLATHRNPERPVRESIRLLCVERRVVDGETDSVPLQLGASSGPVASGEGAANDVAISQGGSPVDSRETSSTAPSGDEATAQPVPGPAGTGTFPDRPAVHGQNGGKKLTRIERVFRFQFGVDAETMKAFARVQSIAARRAGRHVDLSALFGVLCDTYLDRYDATTRAQRRASRKRPGRRVAGDGRHIPQAVRDAVITRDGGRCTFVDRQGERCTETVSLEIDHVRPHALGGSNDISNLRSMCAAHNRLLAERTFGRATVERAIASTESRRAGPRNLSDRSEPGDTGPAP